MIKGIVTKLGALGQTARRKLLTAKKNAHQRLKPYAVRKKVLFIVGCQRSGTTLMLRIFEKDLNTKTFGEFSMLSSEDEDKLRLNPLPLVERDIRTFSPTLIVLKPLVESQNILELLGYFEGSSALWMYRDYRDVALSNLGLFGMRNGIEDLKPIVENERGNWRAERVPKDVRQTILEHFSETMNPYDAAVLFWYARNRLFFELGLDQNPEVLLCKYEELVASPGSVVRSIYSNLNQEYPGPRIHKEIHARSVKRGKGLELSPKVDQVAQALLDRLDKVYQTRQRPTQGDRA